FAAGGAGLLWFEATAISPEARANPRQLLLTAGTVDAFARLRETAMAEGRRVNGADHRPFTVIQLAHSGRYSRPVDRPAPIIAHHDGVLDDAMKIARDHPLITDDALDRLQDTYVAAARLAVKAGFDGVDIKACHRYLISELLAAHTREGKYGGSFENRTRFLLEIVRRVRAEAPGARITLRLNVYDGHPYPWGWGVSLEDPGVPDLREPLLLVRLLHEAGVNLINVTAGNPCFTPHINRPFDQNVTGGYLPDEHPLAGVARIIDLARQVKAAEPELVVLGSGYSWMRQYAGNVAAAVLAQGGADAVGMGRLSFAYPEFARDLITRGQLDANRVCITCSRCTQIMRDHGRSGCVPFDREVYGPIYREGRNAARLQGQA
ncbi:MAG: oxidoreductase, partial [Anaerolineae bacterium]